MEWNKFENKMPKPNDIILVYSKESNSVCVATYNKENQHIEMILPPNILGTKATCWARIDIPKID